ncbi:MAG: hypothetical protein RL213_424 [Bacteroidota bacterium]|jgi:methionine aminotransferase
MRFPGNLSSKLPWAGTTIFTVMSSLAQEHKAINLSQGFPNFETSPELIDLVHHYMKKGMNQYAPMQGILSLRKSIAAKTESLYSCRVDPETEVTITAGGTQAIFTAITAVIREGDEVIVIEPAYDCYVPAIELAGGIPVLVQLTPEDNTVDWAMLRKKIGPKTRMIIVNTPHNPCGTLLTAEDMHELERTTAGTDILILSDEVYEHIIFDGARHESVLRYPALAERSFVIFSFGKTYHTTGWKTGYCIAPENLSKEFRRVHQFLMFCANTPIQHALVDFMENRNYLDLPAFFQAKRDRFLELLKGSAFKFRPAGGSYFQLLDYSAITDERDTDFAVRLTKEYGVASIPTSVFYRQPPDVKVLRFCFAKTDETLEQAADRLQRVRA